MPLEPVVITPFRRRGWGRYCPRGCSFKLSSASVVCILGRQARTTEAGACQLRVNRTDTGRTLGVALSNVCGNQ